MEIIGMERKGGLRIFLFQSLVGVSFAYCAEAMWRTCLWRRTSNTRGGFCLGPHAAQFNEACWLLAGFLLAATPHHCLSLGTMFLGTGLNLFPSRTDLVVVCFLHTPIYRASTKLLNY